MCQHDPETGYAAFVCDFRASLAEAGNQGVSGGSYWAGPPFGTFPAEHPPPRPLALTAPNKLKTCMTEYCPVWCVRFAQRGDHCGMMPVWVLLGSNPLSVIEDTGQREHANMEPCACVCGGFFCGGSSVCPRAHEQPVSIYMCFTGCIIAQVFLGGDVLFNLSDLLAYVVVPCRLLARVIGQKH